MTGAVVTLRLVIVIVKIVTVTVLTGTVVKADRKKLQ